MFENVHSLSNQIQLDPKQVHKPVQGLWKKNLILIIEDFKWIIYMEQQLVRNDKD